MPKKNEKAPANKKTEASSPVKKTGAKKGSKKVVDMDGSFLQLPQLETVSTVPSKLYHNDQLLADKSDAILAYLQRIAQTNQALVKRGNDLESNRSASSTPLGPRPQLSASHIHGSQISQNTQPHSLGSKHTDPITAPTTNHIPSGSASGPGSQGNSIAHGSRPTYHHPPAFAIQLGHYSA